VHLRVKSEYGSICKGEGAGLAGFSAGGILLVQGFEKLEKASLSLEDMI
jgi:hypothetical protein